MKKLFVLFLCLMPLFEFAQTPNPEPFKASLKSNQKTGINTYYNSLLDNYNINFVHLNLNITNETTYLKGNAILHVKAVQLLDTLLLNFSNYMVVDSIFINDAKVTATHANHNLQYIFDTPLVINSSIKVQVYYHGTPTGGGVSNKTNTNWNKKVTWTLSESFHAYEWWPCKQVLSDKIDSAYIYLTCDDKLKAGSNGLLVDEVSLPGNKKRFEWKTYYPIDYYLISFAVSDYQDYSLYAHPDGSDPILIQNYIYNSTGCLDYYKDGIDKTADLIELFSNKFGLYPFRNEKYGHCLAELGGGMEHQTMTTLNSFNFGLVAHELGHMWFGDYVTCASWQDIWINEGFASYTEYVALENLKSLTQADNWMTNAHTYSLQETNGSVYIPFEDAAYETRIFNYALSYKKGAAIIHMIRNEINDDELFFSALKSYLNEYADSVATGEDFKNSLESSTGMDFGPFFDQWYYGKGFPRFTGEYTQLNDTLFLSVNQTGSSPETPLFQIHIDYKITFSEGDSIIRLYQSKSNEDYSIPFGKKIISVEMDPQNKILKEFDTLDSVNTPGNNSFLFKIFPNPATQFVFVQFNLNLHKKLKYVQVFNLNGTLMKEYKSNLNLLTIDVSDFSKGIYFINVNSSGKSYSYKFIKQ